MLRILQVIFAIVLAGLATAHAADGAIVTPVKGSYDDVRDSLVGAIEGRGLVITYTAHIADMLDRTGKDIGAAKRIYEKAESFEFCSAAISRRMMEASPKNIVNCPFSIAIYALPGEKDKVYLAFRRPLPGLSDVHKLLQGIVTEVSR